MKIYHRFRTPSWRRPRPLTSSASPCSSSLASAPTRPPSTSLRRSCASPSSTTGGRPRRVQPQVSEHTKLRATRCSPCHWAWLDARRAWVGVLCQVGWPMTCMPLGLLPSPAIRPGLTARQMKDADPPQTKVTMVTSIPVKPGSSSFPVPGYDIRCACAHESPSQTRACRPIRSWGLRPHASHSRHRSISFHCCLPLAPLVLHVAATAAAAPAAAAGAWTRRQAWSSPPARPGSWR